jgi:peptidoglycan/LPS O-acetylase OafA/YrhL
MTAHRKEIDGLRSIAVLAVVLYHFGLPGLSGGFVGVDVFFVISGFLIGGILWREHCETGRVSLGAFYMRRIRRLAPAYFAMAFVSLVFAALILLPFEFREFGKGLIAATVYLSNVLFFRQAGYFDGASEEKILLHTWSLSVEEQFYLCLPLLVLLFARFKPLFLPGLVVLFALSLLGNLWMTSQSHTAAFYLFPFRAWELLTGVLLAIWGHERRFDWRGLPGMSEAGLGVLILSIVLIKPGEHFPGWQVIAPVFATAALIVNGQADNWVNRILSMRGPVFVGLISYSLYLWHWPVLTLSRYWREHYAGPLETAFWLAICFGLAVLSWRYVETPVRRGWPKAPWQMLVGWAGASAVALGAGAVLFLQDGMVSRFAPQTQVHIRATADFLQDWSRCYVPQDGDLQGVEICPVGPAGQSPDFLVWGDSHIRAFREGLDLAAHEVDRAGLIIWRAGCAPVFDVDKVENSATRAQNEACRAANDQIRLALQAMNDIQSVILVGRWSYYAHGAGVGADAHNTIELQAPGEFADQAALFAAAADRTVGTLTGWGKAVQVVQQVPEVADYDSRLAARRLAHGRAAPPSEIALAAALDRAAAGEAAFKPLATQGRITWLESWGYFCDDAACRALHEEVGQYFDNNHITNSASLRVRGLFAKALADRSQTVEVRGE